MDFQIGILIIGMMVIAGAGGYLLGLLHQTPEDEITPVRKPNKNRKLYKGSVGENAQYFWFSKCYCFTEGEITRAHDRAEKQQDDWK